MRADRPILHTLLWVAAGFLVGLFLLVAATNLRKSPTLNDEASDAAARNAK